MENSNQFLVLREQEELGKRLLQNQSDKAWTAWMIVDPISLLQKEAIKIFLGSIIYKLNINNAGTKVENISNGTFLLYLVFRNFVNRELSWRCSLIPWPFFPGVFFL